MILRQILEIKAEESVSEHEAEKLLSASRTIPLARNHKKEEIVTKEIKPSNK